MRGPVFPAFRPREPISGNRRDTMNDSLLRRVQINMPFRYLFDRYLPQLLREGMNPEIGFDCFALDRFRPEDYRKVADQVLDAGMSVTFHGPFYDLRPGAVDRRIREVTAERFRQVFDLVPLFRPRTVVFHASFDQRYYTSHEDRWIRNSRNMWMPFIERAEKLNTVICIENVYETKPDILQRLFQEIPETPHFRFCFDTGHCNAFARTDPSLWLAALGPYLAEVHLHDNRGETDEHLPVGEGTFPFHVLRSYLSENGLRPVFTLEPHTEPYLRRTLENLPAIGLPPGEGAVP